MLTDHTPADVTRFLKTRRSRSVAFSLRYVDVRNGQTRSRGGRGHDGGTWLLAAWTTIMDLDPTVRWRTSRGTQMVSTPFRSVDHALAWLQENADNPRSPLCREAQRMIKNLRRCTCMTEENPDDPDGPEVVLQHGGDCPDNPDGE